MDPVNFKSDKRIGDEQRVILRSFCEELGGEIVELANSLGVKVFAEELWPYESGYLEYSPTCGSPSNYRIVVNQAHDLNRQRFTVAHELGHFLLHKDLPDFELRKEVANRSNASFDDPFTYLNQMDQKAEREANAFAAAILMPTNLFAPAYHRLEGNTEALSKLFVVSKTAVEVRIKSLGLILRG